MVCVAVVEVQKGAKEMKVEGESRQVNRLVGWKAGPAICECKHCLLLWCWAEVATRCCSRSAAGTDVSEKEAKDVSKVPNRRAFSRRCATLPKAHLQRAEENSSRMDAGTHTFALPVTVHCDTGRTNEHLL